MHTLQGDPPPDDPEFKAHVLCEHSNLTINANNRRRISFRVSHLKCPPGTDAEAMQSVCNAFEATISGMGSSRMECRTLFKM